MILVTPAACRQLIADRRRNEETSHVAVLIVGGEASRVRGSGSGLNRCSMRHDLSIMYGPTETTLDVTIDA